MSKLGYRTRIGDSPQGKQKLYFCCHPEDFEPYFDIIASDIFRCNDNCAIFYEEEPCAPFDREDLAGRLREMRAFVVPVTLRLLRESSRAVSFDIPFARENNIPVIPVAFEAEIDRFFGKIFGDIQYLDRNQDDDTAISFEEKLQKIIDTLLVGTETEKKIREEFAARIFMSYRKKDREHANKVMHRIHEVDFCRDVAIWYDEFLVPGEDFNDAISAAIRGCNVFALTVTPNLLETGNYVGEEEYPAAKKQGKPVLPFEAVRTRGLRLSKYYFGIKAPVDIDDSAAVRRYLKDQLVGKAGKEKLLTPDETPGHLYYMGLAYKNGIDVRKDTARAVALLEKAAAGMPEADLSLAGMYELGDGVSCDLGKAADHYDRFISEVEENVGQDPDRDTVLLRALGSRGDIGIRTGQYEEAEKTYRKQLRIIALMTAAYGSAYRSFLISSYEKLGDICRKQDRLQEAEEFYRKQYEEITALPEESLQKHTGHFRINCLGRLADINKELGKMEEADSYYKEIRHLLEEESKDSDPDAETLYARAISSERQGDSLLSQGRSEEALREYRSALEILARLDKDGKEKQPHMALAVEYGKVGSALAAAGFYEDAEKNYLEAYRIKKEYADNKEDLAAQRSLSVTCSQLHGLFLETEEWDKAEGYLKEDLAIAEMLVGKTDTVEANVDLARTYTGLGMLKSLDVESRLAYMKKAYDIYEMLQEERGVEACAPDRMRTLAALGQLLEERNSAEKQTSPAESEETDREKREEEIKKLLETSDALMKEAAEQASEGKYYFAQASYMKAANIDKDLYEKYADNMILRHLSTIYVRLGELFESHRDGRRAREYYEKDLEIARKLSKGSNSIQARDDLAVSCYKLGMLETVDTDQRVRFLEEAMNIWQQLYNETGNTELYLRAVTMAQHINNLKPLKLW